MLHKKFKISVVLVISKAANKNTRKCLFVILASIPFKKKIIKDIESAVALYLLILLIAMLNNRFENKLKQRRSWLYTVVLVIYCKNKRGDIEKKISTNKSLHSYGHQLKVFKIYSV